MLGRTVIGLAAALVVCAASTVPANSGSRTRAVRPAPSYIPPPAYGYRGDGRAHSPTPHLEVYVNGKYSGTDPDPFIRNMLATDPPWNRTR